MDLGTGHLGLTLRFPTLGGQGTRVANGDGAGVVEMADLSKIGEPSGQCAAGLHGFGPRDSGAETGMPFLQVGAEGEGGVAWGGAGGPGAPLSVRELLYAAVMARATYGPLCEAGFLSSMQRLTNPASLPEMRALLSASPAAKLRSVSRLSGIPESDVLLSYPDASAYRPAHFLAVDRARRVIVLAVRGSMQLGDMLTDLACKSVEAQLW